MSQSYFDFSVFKNTAECKADKTKTKTKLLHGFVDVTSICQSCAAMYFLPIAKKKQAEVSKLVEASALN